MELIQTSVYITKDQREFLQKNFVNLSKMCRASVDNLRKNTCGPDLQSEPTVESTIKEDSNG